MEWIHEKATTAAYDAAGSSVIVNHSGFMCRFAALRSGNRSRMNRVDDLARGKASGGTLIHNGTFCLTQTIGSLAISLIQSCLGRFYITEVGCPVLFPNSFLPATVTAVPMSTIAAAADPEYGTAFLPPTNPLSENIFAELSHSHPKARLDIGCRKWQLRNYNVDNLLSGDVVTGLRS